MRSLLFGATGATGKLLARVFLQRGHHIRAVVRFPDRLPPAALEKVEQGLQKIQLRLARNDSDLDY